jgi:hypothetical protein
MIKLANWLAPVLIVAAALPAQAASPSPVVVELFTSQGCSSCPPANANLIKLSQRKDVLALSFSVTYWDYLGWKDIFDRPEYTDRQVAYEAPLGQQGPFTPQMVINGRASSVGLALGEVEGLIASAKPLQGPKLMLTSSAVEIGAGEAASGADVWLVRYDPNIVDVPVGRGENTGRTLPHTHVVHSLLRLGEWHGAAQSFVLPGAAAGMRTAILVQSPNGGPILSAATDG